MDKIFEQALHKRRYMNGQKSTLKHTKYHSSSGRYKLKANEICCVCVYVCTPPKMANIKKTIPIVGRDVV
jgi:hypothetical protein